MKKISIILPTFNGAKHIQQSIESCLNQSYRDLELIIIDDCSTDDTQSLIHGYIDERIRYFKNEKNEKLPFSLNRGFAEARGDYLTWTSDDNYYDLKAMERMSSFLESDPTLDFIYSDYYELSGDVTPQIKKTSLASQLFIRNSIGPCFLYRRKIYEKLGSFREDLFLCEDYEYWLRIFVNNFKFFKISEPLYFYRKHSDSLTAKKRYEIKRRTDLIRTSYISKMSNYSRRQKSDLFFEIAEDVFDEYKIGCLHNLYLSILNSPSIVFFKCLSFIKLLSKFILGEKISGRLIEFMDKTNLLNVRHPIQPR